MAKRSGEEGYVLLGVLILMALFVIAMAVAAPKVAADIQRDRDLETMHRGKQYIRAIQLYYRKFHAYPPNVDALVKTQEIRFLRKRYLDPTTGKDDWKPIYFGQNKTPMAMGFFGQPLGGTGGSVLGGTGPGGVGSTIGQPIGGNSNSPQSGFGFGSQNPGTSSGSGSGTGSGTGDSGGSTGGTTGGTSGGSGTGITGLGGDSGMTVGGAVIGVSPASTKQSIYVYTKMNHYNEWEFLYSPLMDQPTIAGGGTTGLPTSGTGSTNGNQPNSGFGFGNNNGNNGNSGGNNGNGGLTPPTTSPMPQ
jgi:type II secretory pathway pseudopilin PulG